MAWLEWDGVEWSGQGMLLGEETPRRVLPTYSLLAPLALNEGINKPEQSRQNGKTVSLVIQVHTGRNISAQASKDNAHLPIKGTHTIIIIIN